MSLRRMPEAFCGNLDEVVINSHIKEGSVSGSRGLLFDWRIMNSGMLLIRSL